MIGVGSLDGLAKYDQLRREMEKGACFVGFKEGKRERCWALNFVIVCLFDYGNGVRGREEERRGKTKN